MRLVRLLGRDDRHTGRPSLPAEADVCKAFRFASPLAYLRAERILHASRRLLTQGTLWSLLRAAHQRLADSWLHLLRADLEWLVEICPEAKHLLHDFPDGFAEHALHPRVLSALLCGKPGPQSAQVATSLYGVAKKAAKEPRTQELTGANTAQRLSPLRSNSRRADSPGAAFAALQRSTRSIPRYAKPALCNFGNLIDSFAIFNMIPHLEDDLGVWGTPSPPPAPGLPATRLYGPLRPLKSCSVADFAAPLEAVAEPASERGWISPACRLWLEAKNSG